MIKEYQTSFNNMHKGYTERRKNNAPLFATSHAHSKSKGSLTSRFSGNSDSADIDDGSMRRRRKGKWGKEADSVEKGR